MNVPRLLIAALGLLEAGFMAFDGTRALIVGSLITPRSGPYAGQLGPWRGVVAAFGIDSTGVAMRWVFAVYGWAWLLVLVAFLSGLTWAWWAMLGAAIGALWFLPFGTVLSAIQIALLVWWRARVR